MGIPVSQLQQTIDSHLFAEYQAYYRLEPFGSEPVDIQNSLLIAIMANQNRKKGSSAFTAEAFRIWEVIRPPKDPESLFQQIKSFLTRSKPNGRSNNQEVAGGPRTGRE